MLQHKPDFVTTPRWAPLRFLLRLLGPGPGLSVTHGTSDAAKTTAQVSPVTRLQEGGMALLYWALILY